MQNETNTPFARKTKVKYYLETLINYIRESSLIVLGIIPCTKHYT